MNISLRWLRDFLRRDLDAADVTDRLAMLGAPVDAAEPLHAELAPFVVGRVLEVGPHPDPKATKVRLTKVDDGTGEPLSVVCGAPNVAAGKRYPFARLGTQMPGPKGFRIEARPIRGVVSQGMLCSARELGLGEEHDGILELETEAAPGTPLLDVLPIADTRLVVDVTPNRPDLLCHKGVARELSASFGTPFRLPQIPGAESLDVPPARRAGASDTVGGHPDHDRGRRVVPPVPRRRDPRRRGRPVARLAPPSARGGRRALDQQRGRRDQLRDVRA